MCGIAGLIHRDGTGNIGAEMTAMLQSLKHRGPDSTGYAIYGTPGRNEHVMRFKVAEQEDTRKGFDIHDEIKRRRAKVEERLKQLGVTVIDRDEVTEYAFRYRIQYDGDMKKLADYVEDVDGTEILSMGNALELIKDLGDAGLVSGQYKLDEFKGTHGIGHTRMATESDVDIRSAHPYWAYPYNDIAVVHNGQLTNYWQMRREFERRGHRFMSNCDSELLAVYTAYNLEHGATLEELAASSRSRTSTACSPISSPPRTSSAWPRTPWRPSRWCSTRATIWSRWPPRRWRSAASFPTRSTPGIPMTRRCAYGGRDDGREGAISPMRWGCTPKGLRGRTQQRFFDVTEENVGFGYPDALDVDFNKRAEIDAENMNTRQINAAAPRSDEEGLRHHRGQESRLQALPRRRHPQSPQSHLRGLAAAISAADSSTAPMSASRAASAGRAART